MRQTQKLDEKELITYDNYIRTFLSTQIFHGEPVGDTNNVHTAHVCTYIHSDTLQPEATTVARESARHSKQIHIDNGDPRVCIFLNSSPL